MGIPESVFYKTIVYILLCMLFIGYVLMKKVIFLHCYYTCYSSGLVSVNVSISLQSDLGEIWKRFK